nr:hypothetical protein [Tanacetum cinerariifolium]
MSILKSFNIDNTIRVHSSAIFTAVASLFFWQWELSSPAVGTSPGSGNSITGSGNALCILFPIDATLGLEKFSTTSSSPDHLLEEFAGELALITFPPGNDNLPFDIKSDLREIKYLLNHDPTKEIDSILEMFTDEHTLDYSSLPLYDDFNDDLFEHESDNVYDDPFDSKEDKIKESKLLIDELDPPRSSDFLPSPQYDSFLFEDFSEVDAFLLTNNEDKGLYKNHRIQLHPIESNAHVEDIVEFETAIAQTFLYLRQCKLLAVATTFTGSENLYCQWELYPGSGNALDDDKLYKFKEGDLTRLRIQDIEDMLLLLVQGKLANLTVEECFAFNVSFRMFTRSIVIQRRVEDLQLGVESYQKKLNLTRPDMYRSDLKRKEAYIAYSNLRGFIYQNKDKQNRLMRIDELRKFSDGTLTDVRTALDDRLKEIRMKYLPQTI